MPASPEYLKSQLARANSLETRLKDCKDEENASQLRIQLCEVFSDLILIAPSYCLEKDCLGRLWRVCFYARIQELRSRLSREKRKHPDSSNFKKLQNLLKQFLKEGIEFYKFFVEQYEGKLLPSDTQDSEEVELDGVVAGLHRILIYLGDLYRYSANYTKAQDCYERASRLAPSKGNPYNQLAVVAQLKDAEAPLSCVALYYYARSLLATRDPFPTSKNNVERLLESNREWLQNTSEQSLLDSQTYAQKVDIGRAKKTVASRLFLSRFVNVHYDFFQTFSFHERQARENELVVNMNVVLLKLEALLQDWAFGDALLMKMVTINAFSIEWTQSKTLARAFLLKSGAALAERLESSLKKAMTKKTLSLRLLMPLLLLSEYVSSWPVGDNSPDKALSTKAREFCVDAKEQYWTKLASVATHLIPLCNQLGLDEMNTEGMILKEYENLQGFAPFNSFVNTKDNGEDVYLSVDDAVCALQLSQSATPNTSQPAEENALKLKRFFEVVDTMVEKKLPICCVNGQYRVFSLKSDENGVVDSDDDDHMMDEDNAMVDFDATEQDTKNQPINVPNVPPRVPIQKDKVLEYKQPEGGAGPALLVPGALLLYKTQESSPPTKPPAPVVTTERPSMDTTPSLMQPQQISRYATSRPAEVNITIRPPIPRATAAPPLGPPPGLLPPPGFGGPTATAPGFTAPNIQPPPAMAVGYASYPSNQTLPDRDTVLQMLRGMDTNTSNPFMASDNNVDDLFASSSMSETDVEGMSLLDSSLLHSMMMDDSSSQPRSRNPFLT